MSVSKILTTDSQWNVYVLLCIENYRYNHRYSLVLAVLNDINSYLNIVCYKFSTFSY